MSMEPQEERVTCPLCSLKVPEEELDECFICRARCCRFCALYVYGRTFCSERCRGVFFWGDGEHDEKDY
jgi:hypothetical protein